MARYRVAARQGDASGPIEAGSSPADQRLTEALAHHRAGKLADAEKLYAKLLREEKNNARAMTLLGTLLAQQGRFAEAVKILARSLQIDPRQSFALNSLGNAYNALARHQDALGAFEKSIALKPEAATYSNSGNVLRALKRYRDALSAYRKALAVDPGYADAHSNSGDLLLELKRYDDAVLSYDKAIALRADSVRDWFGRAVALQESDRIEQALESYDRVLALKSDFADAWNNRGNALARLRRYVEAQECYANAVALNPNYAEACNNWGNVLRGVGRFHEAVARYERAVALKPDYAHAHTNLGLALLELRLYEAALESFDNALRIAPKDADAHNNRGNAWRGLRNYHEARASYDRAIACKPDYAAAHHNRGLALDRLGRTADALASYDVAIERAPGDAGAYFAKANTLRRLKRFDHALPAIEKAIELDAEFPYALGERLVIKLRMCDWSGLRETCAAVTSAIGRGSRAASPFSILAIEGTPAHQRRCAEIYAKDKYPPLPLPETVSATPASASENERIRVAYLSSDFHAHATSYLIAGVLEQHDRSRFEVYAISFGKSDGSEMRARLERVCEHFIDVGDMSDREVAALLRAERIDIAIDLKGYTRDARTGIFAFRPVPIQVNYLGYPGTMGADYIDYLIADDVVVPKEDQPSYSEKIVYLPDTYQCNDSKRAIADAPPSRAEAGLPETGFVFCSFNNNYKITPELFDIWMRLLKETEGSVLWLLESNPAAARNLSKEAEARGVDSKRIVFAPFVSPSAHLARISLADLFLDSLPCCAHTTASDALWAGVPVSTCIGNTFAGRVAASLLNAIGLPELVTYSYDAYETLALNLARDPAMLEGIKAKLARNRMTHPLFDTARFTRHLETAYLRMQARRAEGLPPAGFAVEAMCSQ